MPSTISVILIVRNGADYIAEALTSVYPSYLQPLEIIVVDGHSSDDTVAIASQFPKVRIHPQTSFGIPNVPTMRASPKPKASLSRSFPMMIFGYPINWTSKWRICKTIPTLAAP